MATGAMGQVVNYLRRVTLPPGNSNVTDGQLLKAFLADREEAAFALLVRRHGAMVLGVCRRVLGNVHDAEDAFQATFLVLARKAGSVVPREQVGNWLHGVALRTALEARARRARRRAREMQVTDMPHPTVSAEVNWDALHRLLDQELSRLPVKYQSAIVLCDLEGRSRKEAARQLGLAEGTLSSRLATGRQMLARRLLRHGLTLPAAGLAAALATQVAAASVRPALLSATTKAAVLAGPGSAAAGLVSAQVISLSQGVLKTMFLYRLKVLTVLLTGVALGGVGAGAIVLTGNGQVVAGETPAPVARAAPSQPAEPEEPLEGRLLLDQQIQKELRLSPGQVKRLQQAAADADRGNEGVRKEIQQLQERIAKLQKEAQGMHEKIAGDREHALRDAAPGILSARALTRLRQIQRQSRGPEQLLKDPRVQRLLKLDDEQMMKIEKTFKDTSGIPLNLVRATNVQFDLGDELLVAFGLDVNPKMLAKVAEVLTEAQRRSLRAWLGEPFRATHWTWLWSQNLGKDR